MNVTDQIRAETPAILKKYAVRSNTKALIQNLNTLIPYFVLFYLAMDNLRTSWWLSTICIIVLSFFTVRIFMLMHDCGHKSLFRTQAFNTIGGFITGVLVGMPQYVWSQHHNYHHATNGNWEKYRGPLNIMSVDEFDKLSPVQQKLYRYRNNILLAPVGAFFYFIFNPRFNWMLGSIRFAFGVMSRKLKNPDLPLEKLISLQESPYWKTAKEYRHMTMNNLVLISIWIAASWYFGAATFFTVYVISLCLAGAAGIIIFTIQHNFEGSYAADSAHWDYHQAALTGTSFLTFPQPVHWFGLNIAYHHIHHISAGIPNYNLAACHREYEHLFDDVKRIRLRDIAHTFRHILWYREGQRIISIDQYNSMKSAA